ncbi:SCO family protein [Shewanella sp. KX20019]|uniref:SCO family protein n=1 Tax=Shewanella sp. KX20019 TaxID=2803864 RepID=UPI001928B854|nr:SCO family protein [Shewanella sp. KX20019]QQX79490.1 SCO family protein [Shewanella sp. KX20019]
MIKLDKQTKVASLTLITIVLALIFLSISFTAKANDMMPILKGIGGNFSLQSSRGGEVSLSDFEGKVLMMFFGYTNCADICPTTMAHISQLMNSLPPKQREQVQVLFISIDSEYDTPKHLNKYLSYFDPNFIGLVDSRDKIDHVAELYKAEYAKLANEKVTTEYKKLSLEGDDKTQKGYLYSHTAKIFVIDGKARVRGFFYTGTPIADMKQQLISLL